MVLGIAVTLIPGPAVAAPGITPGAFCAKADAGRVSYSSGGGAYVCSSDGKRYRWRSLGGSSVPDPTAPDPTVPDPTAPDPTVPDPTMPDPTMPDPVTPGATTPPTSPPAVARPVACRSSIAFNASPEPLKLGASATLAGTTGCGASNNTGKVRFYFRKYTAGSYVLVATAPVQGGGKFLRRLKQHASGYWKAHYDGNAVRRPVDSAVDYVEVRGPRGRV